jgi:GrpB-like predicted nucleotidyltransferase (UPF0157 family)
VADIQHIGSTSVPGLAAKPIVDVGVAIEEYPLPETSIQAVVALGYEHVGEYGIPRRHYFRKGRPRTHHLHVLEVKSDEWGKHILFRDYMRAHREEALRYEALKRELARVYQHDREAYTEGKTEFVLATLAKAQAWREAAPRS